MQRWTLVLGLCLFAILSSGCSIKYKAVAVFDDSREVFIGDLDHNLLSGRAQILASSTSTKTVCRGYSYVTYIPPFSLGCAGQQGKAPMICTDGRKMTVEWTAESCSSGSGYGIDQYGNTLSLAFGFDEEGAKKTLANLTGEGFDDPAGQDKENKQSVTSDEFTSTGFFITDSGVLVTSYHAVKDTAEIWIMIKGERHAASIINIDVNNDLAILQAKGLQAKPLTLAPMSDLKRGDEILVLGYPLSVIQGNEQKATRGRVNALSGFNDDIRYLQIDASVQPGSAGGPLLDNKGEVMGVITSGLGVEAMRQSGAVPQNVGYAVKIDYLWPLLRAAIPDATLPSAKNAPSSMPEVIAKCEDSVVMLYLTPQQNNR